MDKPNEKKDENNQPDKKKAISIIIDGVEFQGEPKEFKSGRHGYGLYGLKKIRGYPHRLSINIIEVGENV